MSTKDRNVSLLTTLLGGVAALLVMVTVGVLLQGWTLRRMAEERESKIFERPYPELEVYLQEQERLLSVGYEWVDREAGIVHLPIERAMALVVQEQGAHRAADHVDKAGVEQTGATQASQAVSKAAEEAVQ